MYLNNCIPFCCFSILGRSENGVWIIESCTKQEEEEEEDEEEGTIYMYEGRDYSRCSEKDRMAFDQLIAGGCGQLHHTKLKCDFVLIEKLRLTEAELGTRVLRGEHRTVFTGTELPLMRKRKPLSDEQLEERRKKVSLFEVTAQLVSVLCCQRQEAKEKRIKLMAAEEQRKAEEKKKRKCVLHLHYCSE